MIYRVGDLLGGGLEPAGSDEGAAAPGFVQPAGPVDLLPD